jgi:hypothetical protein
MSTQGPGQAKQAQRRLVLRKIPGKAGRLPSVTPAPPKATSPAVARPAIQPPPAPVALRPVLEIVPDSVPAPPEPGEVVRPRASSVHSSAPPVVATVITPLGTVLDAPARKRRDGSPMRGVYVGTVLGLAIVGMFVTGARLAHRPGEAPPVAAAAAMQGAAVATPVTATATNTASPALGAPPPPVIAATALPIVAPPARKASFVGGPRTVANAAPASKPGVVTTAAATASAIVASNAATPAADPPEDNAQSLVPVIPASAPVVDPLVKAVQQDIQEDQQAHPRR